MICYPPMGAKDLFGWLQIKDDLFVSQFFQKVVVILQLKFSIIHYKNILMIP
jgi:hypothetical protein